MNILKVLTFGLLGKKTSDTDPMEMASNLHQLIFTINYFQSKKQFHSDLQKVFGNNLENCVKDIDGIFDVDCALSMFGFSSIKDIEDSWYSWASNGRDNYRRNYPYVIHTADKERIEKLALKGKLPSITIEISERLYELETIKEVINRFYYLYLEKSGHKNKNKFFIKSCPNCKCEFVSQEKFNEIEYGDRESETDVYTFEEGSGCCPSCSQFLGTTPENKYFSQALKSIREFEQSSGLKVLPSIRE